MPDQTPPEAEILFRSGATVTPEAQLWIRNRIGISTIQAVGDANTTITAGTTTVRLSASLTAARIYTLPNPASYAVGETLVFTDTIGSLTTANTVTLSAGAGTVNGVATMVLTTPYASPILISNGVDKWTLNTPVTRATLSLATTDAPTFGGLTVNGPINTNTANSIGWTNSTRMGASLDGNLTIYSTAASPFSAIHIGSTSSAASPAFKFGFSGTTIALRATNDTVDANLTCADITSSGASAASAPAVRLTGAVFTGGTGMTTTPHLLIEPTGTTAATTWNTAGTAIGVNAASGFTGNFLDFHTNGGSSIFSVGSGGVVLASASIISTISVRAGINSRLEINGRGGIGASADGVFQLRNNLSSADGSLTIASLSATAASTIGDAASTSEQLTILGGANGGPMLKLSRTSGVVISYDWNLAGNALNFRDSTSGVNLTVMQLTAASSIPTIVAGADLGAGVGTTPTGGLIRSAHSGTGVTDVSGANLTISSGRGTGAGAIPSILFQTYNTTATGTTLQTATTKMILLGNGNFGIAQSTPTEKLHVTGNILASGSVTSNTLVRAGADLSAILPAGIDASMTSTGQDWAFIGGGGSVSNSTDKQTRIGGLHYTAGEEPVTGMYVFSTSAASSVLIGGGTSLGNAATSIEFYTAANNTTTIGTSRWNINNAGNFLASSNGLYDIGSSAGFKPKNIFAAGYVAADSLVITDGIPALSASAIGGSARIYVDSADGDLKIIFGDGTIKTIVTDT